MSCSTVLPTARQSWCIEVELALRDNCMHAYGCMTKNNLSMRVIYQPCCSLGCLICRITVKLDRQNASGNGVLFDAMGHAVKYAVSSLRLFQRAAHALGDGTAMSVDDAMFPAISPFGTDMYCSG